jgi:hypothetical protein
MESAMVSEVAKIFAEIDKAKDDVVAAHRSGDVNKINRADRKLADLNYQRWECAAGLVPDDRG